MITTEVFADRVEMHAFGRLSLAECKEFESLSDYRLHFNGALDLLLDLRGLESCSLDALLEPIRYCRMHHNDFKNIALLTTDELVIWFALFSQALIDAEIRVFDAEEAARAWLGEPQPLNIGLTNIELSILH